MLIVGIFSDLKYLKFLKNIKFYVKYSLKMEIETRQWNLINNFFEYFCNFFWAWGILLFCARFVDDTTVLHCRTTV